MILLGEHGRRLSDDLRHTLECFGHDVRVATDGDAVLRQVLAYLPDLILLDVDLPGRDVLDLERELKRIPWTRRLPILFLIDPGAVPLECQFRSVICLRKSVPVGPLLEAVSMWLKPAAAMPLRYAHRSP